VEILRLISWKSIVDEPALSDALRDGSIAGAGLDVFYQEPLGAHHPLRELRHTALTPHLGYVTGEDIAGLLSRRVEHVAVFLAGAPIRVLTA
jgi:phosphoglycerate dehydrogenase-like enzyme